MRCPQCGFTEDKVVDSRPSNDGRSIRRRRECLECGNRFTTYEYVEHGTLAVVKTDGRREPFDRHKLMSGLKLACNKRPVSPQQLETIVDEIEKQLSTRNRAEITSNEIGEMVMDRLRQTDEVAYVRFASVYRNFKDKGEFLNEVKKLLE